MAYNEFAYFYDEFNGEADYEALFGYIHAKLQQAGIQDGIVADLGCGTGDLTLMLAQAGYDMIGVDQSEEMLSVVRDKADQLEMGDRLLLLQQDILELDLYGTIRAVVSTFDTYNHIPPDRFETAIRKAAFFMEEGGLFVFDMNTPYKHWEVLGENRYEIETPEARCLWQNHYDKENRRVEILLTIENMEEQETYHEDFYEYSYELGYVKKVLEQYGFQCLEMADGEDFGPLREKSQRVIFTARKQYTQESDQNGK